MYAVAILTLVIGSMRAGHSLSLVQVTPRDLLIKQGIHPHPGPSREYIMEQARRGPLPSNIAREHIQDWDTLQPGSNIAFINVTCAHKRSKQIIEDPNDFMCMAEHSTVPSKMHTLKEEVRRSGAKLVVGPLDPNVKLNHLGGIACKATPNK